MAYVYSTVVSDQILEFRTVLTCFKYSQRSHTAIDDGDDWYMTTYYMGRFRYLEESTPSHRRPLNLQDTWF